nr:carboxylesterase [Pharsalia antennata]
MMIFLFYFSVLIVYAVGDPGSIISIPQGRVQGTHQKSYNGRTYTAFEGIPYGKPPVGDLRFEEPIPADKWSGVLVADNTYMCMSFIPLPMIYGPRGTEDCLYVYVYVPRENVTGNENLDVVVHIHGGAFMVGSPKFMAGPSFIMDKEVIYVSFNYRLAILGFLSTEDEVVPGNNGLKDQSLAMKWIKENIKYFGGNPESVTLTGLSAGAASVHYHYLSPLSKGLFHRGFSQSGTALEPWALTENPLAKAKTVAVTLGCTTESTQSMIQCLKKAPVKKLILAMKSLLVFMDIVPFTIFGPVVEKGGNNPFISQHPYKLLKDGKVYDVPWVASNTIHEGLFPAGLFVTMQTLSELDKRWSEIAPYALDIQDTVAKADQLDVVTKARKYYLKDEPMTKDNIYSLVELFTDRIFKMSCEKAIRAHVAAVKSPVYYYVFAYILEMRSPIFYGFKPGSAHSDDGRLLFPIFGTPLKLKENDENMMKLFTGFAETYAKANKPSFNNVEWKPIDRQSENIDYLEIASPADISMKTLKELGRPEFWNNLPIMENDKLF